jgi:pyruvate/2-oxoglutarate dehydrogenase complex dihydrolipoamide acyltransferase (E2) component
MIGNTSPALLLFGIIALLLLAVGMIAAVITYVGKSREKDRSQALAAERAVQPAPHPTPAAPSAAAEPAAIHEAPAHPGEVMRVIRDQDTGRVLVQVDGKQYAHIREIHDAQVGRRVLWAIADLVRFTGGMATNPQAVRSVLDAAPDQTSAPQRQPDPAASASPAATPDLSSARPRAPVSRPSPSYSPPQPTTSNQSKRYNMIDYFRQGFQNRGASEPIPSATSFIDEIEEILQASLRALPAPLPYEVHVLSGETGVLQIDVGNRSFGSPDEVPDPQIRQLIKAAVAEWEKR